ncbi:MAG: pentapeptide repeat-containing protein [Candidatus Methanoperedens sp.]|nr:pentapeptide repeat-containing protein [Candidatus Methanoperedens sp.]MCZ7406575.1 pentapeptide repeat-containing protein [Candidatus Methanoperedens sp.]
MSDEVCQVDMWHGNPCGRQRYKDKKECIFHLENKSPEEAKIFKIEFWKELDRMEKDKDIRELDFTRFIFPSLIDFHGHLFEKHVYFSHAQFNDKAVFSHAHFNNITVFSNAHFNKNVSFTGTHFNKLKVYFSFVQFKELAYFYSTEFNYVDFEGAVFWGEGHFIGTKFLSANKDLIFFGNGIPYEDIILFEDVKFHDPKNVKFQNIDLSNVSFLNTDVSEIQFLDVKWRKIPLLKLKFHLGSRLAVIDETRIEKDYSTTYDAVAQLYRRFRRNYETNYRFAEAGDFFIGEMEMRRLDVNTGYLFNWNNIWFNEIPKINDNPRLIEFLTKKFDIDWVKMAKIKKIDDQKAIYITDEKNSLELRLNAEKTKVNLTIDDGRTYELFAKIENGKLNIYNTRFNNEKIRNVVLWLKRNVSFLGLYKYLSLYGESYVLPMIWASAVIVSYPMLMRWLFNASLPQSDDFPHTYLRTSAASFFQMQSTYIGERIIGFLLLGLLFIALKRKFERKK